MFIRESLASSKNRLVAILNRAISIPGFEPGPLGQNAIAQQVHVFIYGLQCICVGMVSCTQWIFGRCTPILSKNLTEWRICGMATGKLGRFYLIHFFFYIFLHKPNLTYPNQGIWSLPHHPNEVHFCREPVTNPWICHSIAHPKTFLESWLHHLSYHVIDDKSYEHEWRCFQHWKANLSRSGSERKQERKKVCKSRKKTFYLQRVRRHI